jgi:hypothetical protein
VRGPLPNKRGLPDVDPPVPSPILGQMVMVLPGVPVQLAENVPAVVGVPPTLRLTLPKLMSVIEKLQDWDKAALALNHTKQTRMKKSLTSIAVVQLKFAFLFQLGNRN